MSKISVSQRKYFVERIEKSIDDKVAMLKQSNAADVQAISERAYKKYLKHIGVDKDIKEYLAKKVRTDVLSDRITAIFNEIKKSVKTDDRWDNSEPHMYTNISESDIEKGFKWCCNKTAHKQETETAAGKAIADLENRKRASVDQLHGINELQELTLTVNNILNGAGVPLIGE